MVIPAEGNSGDIFLHRVASGLSHSSGHTRQNQLSKTREGHQAGLPDRFPDRKFLPAPAVREVCSGGTLTVATAYGGCSVPIDRRRRRFLKLALGFEEC